MQIHHLNCGTMCPACRRLLTGDGGLLEAAQMVCHCMLVETPDGWLLVDTGIGLADIERRGGLGRVFNTVARPKYDSATTARRQIEALGIQASDVRHIAVSHLDLDHAGGIADFPEATVHVHVAELEAALAPNRPAMRAGRYIDAQLDCLRTRDASRLRTYAADGEPWNGFPAQALQIPGSADSFALVALRGHSAGHSGIAIHTNERWLLHCGDAYMHRATVRDDAGTVPIGIRAFQRLVAETFGEFAETQRALRDVNLQNDSVALVSAHDTVEFLECTSQTVKQ